MERTRLTFHFIMELRDASERERHPHGEVRTEAVDDHVLVMTLGRVDQHRNEVGQ